MEKKRILTGDRPTGMLHIGHLLGSLLNRVKLQNEYDSFIEIANIQALSDNFENPLKVKESVMELLCDYYASGLDFDKANVFIQSEVPEIHEIFIYLANFATVQQIQHNPTIKTEMSQKRYENSTPLGFFVYPIHQAADIFSVNADLVPVGKDQLPMIEDAREIGRRFNSTYCVDILGKPDALLGTKINVPGIDGAEKMGKSLNNCIYLSDSQEELRKKVFKVYTDPKRIHADDPGHIEGNVAFVYLDLFANEAQKIEVEEMKKRYQEGTIKDVEVKERLFEIMDAYLLPIRERRKEAEGMKEELLKKTLNSSHVVSEIARDTADKMKKAMKIEF